MKIIKLLTFAICTALVIAGCGGGGGGGGSSAAQKQTVMVYMVGSDLQSNGNFGTVDLQEMMTVGSSSNMNVVVATGGANTAGWTTVKYNTVNQGAINTISDLGSLNMAASATLQDFIVWAENNYPADKYILILWDHGGGAIGGFGADENFGMQSMSLPNLTQAISGAKSITGKDIEVIGFDACLMATIEVASALSPYAKYLVASEETEPGTGWDYTSILSAIKNNPAITGSSLGQVIADSYKAQVISSNPDEAKAISLSVVELANINNVVAALDSLSGQIQTNIALENIFSRPKWDTVSRARSQTEDYGNDVQNSKFTDMADLKRLAELLNASFPAEASALFNSLSQAVVYKINGADRPNANGLSVYFPYKTTYDAAYSAINFSNTYKTMLGTYVALKQADIQPPQFTNFSVVGNTMTATITDDDIAAVEIAITMSDPLTGIVTFLGTDLVYPDPPDSVSFAGSVSFTWSGQWVTMNDNFISFMDLGIDGNIIWYGVPALLNGSPTNIFVTLDNVTGNAAAIGAWDGISATGAADKDIVQIKQGDVITPLFMSYDIAANTYTLENGTPFTIGVGGVTFGFAPLPAGTYNATFLATDYAQQQAISPFAAFIAP